MTGDATGPEPRPSEGPPGRTPPSRPRIFVIGHNKCGTTSLHTLFTKSGIVSSHWIYKGRNLALTMVNNMALGRHPLAGLEKVEAFTDLNHVVPKLLYVEATRFFREIHAFEPDGYFILNTRNEDRWVQSRIEHGLGKQTAEINGLSVDEVTHHWRQMFRRHHAEARAHFAGNPRFLEFDIETGDISAVADLLSGHYQIDTAHWGKHFASAEKHLRPQKLALANKRAEGSPEPSGLRPVPAETAASDFPDEKLPAGAEAFLSLLQRTDMKPRALKQVRQLVRNNPALFLSSESMEESHG